MESRLFLPARRGDGLTIYEYRKVPGARRHDFSAVAQGHTPDAISPTGVSPLPDTELARCRAAAAAFIDAEPVLRTAGLADMSSIGAILKDLPEHAWFGGTPLLTLALYLELHRQVARAEAALSDYAARPAALRVAPGLTGSVYLAALTFDEVPRGRALLDADEPHLPQAPDAPDEWAYVLSLAAALAERSGDDQASLRHLSASARIRPSARSLQRIAGLRHQTGDLAGAIQTLLDADALEPLSGAAAHRLAWWYLEARRTDEADRWREIAEARLGKTLIPLRRAVEGILADDKGDGA